MERESFENQDTAKILNDNYVAVKLDREERPDIDNLYMSACIELNGHGGWPLSVFLTPDKKPFFAGSYFPLSDNYGMPGFNSLLITIKEAWSKKKKELMESADNFAMQLNETAETHETDILDPVSIDDAFQYFIHMFDPDFGGFGKAPKFPSPYNLIFLMRTQPKKVKDIIVTTLKGITKGGIHDHVAGGFCRYSTDKMWLVPHFEKMLYDNALLIYAYTEAIQAYKFDNETADTKSNSRWNYTVHETLEYLNREMLSPEGAFYTAQDADSEGEEGKFYVWTPDEINKILGETDGERFCRLMDITERGNFEGKSIPNSIGKKISQPDVMFLGQCMPKVLEARMKRIQPFKDDKILLSNNGLMIAALAKAGHALCDQRYINRARIAVDFILQKMVINGRLFSSYRDGKTAHPATLDGYAYFVWALIELYEATFEPGYLKQALLWNKEIIHIFMEGNKLYFSGSDVEDLPLRQQNASDGAVPSGQGIAALNMIRLSRMSGDASLEDTARRIISGLADEIMQSPAAYTSLLLAEMYMRKGGFDVVLVNGSGIEGLVEVTRKFYPFCTFTMCGEGYEDISEIAPFTIEMIPYEGKATAFACRRGACMQPVTDAAALEEILNPS